MRPNIPKDQLERIEPIVETLVAELRSRTHKLACEIASALVYQLEPDPLRGRPFSSEADR